MTEIERRVRRISHVLRGALVVVALACGAVMWRTWWLTAAVEATGRDLALQLATDHNVVLSATQQDFIAGTDGPLIMTVLVAFAAVALCILVAMSMTDRLAAAVSRREAA